MTKLLTTLSILFIATAALAETIILKSSKEIKGTIVEKTDEYLKVEIMDGVSVTYYLDEINEIIKNDLPQVIPNEEIENDDGNTEPPEQNLTIYQNSYISEIKDDQVEQNNIKPKKLKRRKAKRDIRLSASTIRDGMEKLNSKTGKIITPKPYKKTVEYKENVPIAKKAGINLDNYLDRKYIVSYKNRQFFMLFYNWAEALRCKRKYLIQKVKMTNIDYRHNGEIKKLTVKYLVEVFKLNQFKKIKSADQHIKRHALFNNSKRETTVECKIGCGEIPGIISGNSWPYGSKKLYKKLQDYSLDPGLYNDVKFDFSSEYEMGFSFDKDGNFDYKLPYFLQ